MAEDFWQQSRHDHRLTLRTIFSAFCPNPLECAQCLATWWQRLESVQTKDVPRPDHDYRPGSARRFAVIVFATKGTRPLWNATRSRILRDGDAERDGDLRVVDRVAKTTHLPRTGSSRSRCRQQSDSPFQRHLEPSANDSEPTSDGSFCGSVGAAQSFPPFRSAPRGIDLRQPLPIRSAYRSVGRSSASPVSR
jgi:hypothetical protein